MNILGISAFYHDSAAALVSDGEIIAAAQEERFTRKKHDSAFPINAIAYCLAEGNLRPGDLDVLAFYDKPITKFARILETYLSVAPKGLRSFMMAIPIWMKEKLWIPYQIEMAMEKNGFRQPKATYFTEHHESHAASAFFPSPFTNAAILTIDGVGEWATSSLGYGKGNNITLLKELRFPHSLGLLYSAFTYFAGFKINSGEYKLMGLAPYGKPKYVDAILKHLIEIKDDGSIQLNMKYFNYVSGLTMTTGKFDSLFGGPPRKPESEITQREMDLAKSIQIVTEEVVLKMAIHVYKLTGENNLCLAGGVALNCVANGRLLREGPFDNIWIQPAAGDAGGALGAALTIWHKLQDKPRDSDNKHDKMKGSYLGPGFEDNEIEAYLTNNGFKHYKLTNEEWAPTLATLLDEQKVIGLFQGRMEFGPRALGNRSIIGDPRSPQMQSIMNLKIKYRESFRPFAPSCLEECVNDFFEMNIPSPYMLLVAPVRTERCKQDSSLKEPSLREGLHAERSDVPAITHVDYSARVQTVNKKTNPRYYDLIKAFEARTGYGIIINTSFNVRGEPIVCTPEEAYRCFMRTEMDILVLGSYILRKEEQTEWNKERNGCGDYVLD